MARPDWADDILGSRPPAVTDEMVEAGARGRYEYQRRRAPDLQQPEFDELPPAIQDTYRHEAEASINAALGLSEGAVASSAPDSGAAGDTPEVDPLAEPACPDCKSADRNYRRVLRHVGRRAVICSHRWHDVDGPEAAV